MGDVRRVVLAGRDLVRSATHADYAQEYGRQRLDELLTLKVLWAQSVSQLMFSHEVGRRAWQGTGEAYDLPLGHVADLVEKLFRHGEAGRS